MTMRFTYFLAPLFSIVAASPSLAETEGRWIKGGTFATSGYEVNNDREATYRGSGREDRRLSAYLPGMTIVYGDDSGGNAALGYSTFQGNTQSGVPLAVISSDVSNGAFDDRPFRDVVVHQSHLVCKQVGCDDTERVSVGIGQGYRIDEEDDQNVILTNADELTIHYSASELNRLELEGFLTRHANRTYPRLQIREGYASELSLGCGGTLKAGTAFSIDEATYNAPDTWSLNSVAWDIKAVELFGFGTVEFIDGKATATLSSDFTTAADGVFAIDVTIFAFEDAEDASPSSHTFAGIYADVKCENLAQGRTQLTYVESASFRFGDIEVELPQQLEEAQKVDLARRLGRSFLYSFNSADSYFRFLPILVENLGDYHHAAFVVSRLNATCARSKRASCDEIAR